MRLILKLLILILFQVTNSLPFAPAVPDFNTVKADLMTVVNEDELQNLRHNGFQEQLRHLRDRNIGRDPKKFTEEMARIRNSIEDISEFSLDSAEVDESLEDITIPSNSEKIKKSSKFSELSRIHNTDASNRALPPFAFSEDEQESVQKVETVPPTIINTRPTYAPTTTTTTTTTTLPPTTTRALNIVQIDSHITVPRKISSNSPIPVIDRTVTTFHPTRTTTFSPPTTRYSPVTPVYYTARTPSPHVFSSSTIRLPAPISLATTTSQPYRGAPFTTEFTITPAQKRAEGPVYLRDRIRSTSQLLNLLGDKIEGIDQQATRNGTAPRTGVLANVHDRGEVKRRNLRSKHWGITGSVRNGNQVFDGQFTGMAYGSTKQKGGGYMMRRKVAKRPWNGRYKTRRLGDRTALPFLEKRTTDVAVEPYGSKRKGGWARGVKVSERRLSDGRKNFAQALLESEEVSMRQLKKTLRQIRDVVKAKTSTTSAPVVRKLPLEPTVYKGIFDFRH